MVSGHRPGPWAPRPWALVRAYDVAMALSIGALTWFVLSVGATPGTAQVPNLTAVLTASSNRVAPGDIVSYFLTVTNRGPGAATGVSATIVVPGSGVFVMNASAPAGWSTIIVSTPSLGSDSIASYSGGQLAPGQGAVLALAVKVRLHGPGESVSARACLLSMPCLTSTVSVAGSGPEPTATSQIAVLAAQVTPLGSVASHDLAHDPINGLFLVAGNREPSVSPVPGPVVGSVLDSSGMPASGIVEIDPEEPAFGISTRSGVRIVHSPHVLAGADVGGFLVVWTETFALTITSYSILARAVSSPGLSAGARGTVSTGFRGSAASLAYSLTSRVVLTVWPDCSSPFPMTLGCRVLVRRVGLDAQPIGAVIDVGSAAASTPSADVAWNPITNEFGIAFMTQSGEASFVRVAADGTVLGHAVVGYGVPDIAVNTDTGHYVIVWGRAGEGVFGAEISPGGVVVSGGLVSRATETAVSPELAYNPVSGTFLVARVGLGNLVVLELNKHGAPLSVPMAVPLAFAAAGLPTLALTSHLTQAEWRIAVQSGPNHWTQGLSTSARQGSSDVRLGGCATPDPFGTLGGGFCHDGGWFPPGMPAPWTLPTGGFPPNIPVCAAPDPFVSLGGGTCHQGNWIAPPAGGTLGPAGCPSPDPFATLGGGTCHAGGWLPPGMSPPAVVPVLVVPMVPVPMACLTPDPFTTLGGGICINGGWRPRGGS